MTLKCDNNADKVGAPSCTLLSVLCGGERLRSKAATSIFSTEGYGGM